MRIWFPAVLVPALLLPRPPAAQVPEVASTLSKDSVALAEVFEWRVEVPVPAGSLVYFPDELPATPDVESFAPVEWRSARGADGGATLTLTYELIPFATGTVTLPRLDLIIVPAVPDAEGERIPGGSFVGLWSDAPSTFRNTLGVTSAVWVAPAYTSEDVVAGLSPRPPADVVGLGWSWSSLALILLFATVLGGTVVTTTREWLASRPEADKPPAAGLLTLDEARRSAIDELDRLLATGPWTPDRTFDVYATSSQVVRGFAERLRPGWGPELTSSELMARLEAAGLAGPELLTEMGRAEAVKFGRVRPAEATTDTHLRALRSWVSESRR